MKVSLNNHGGVGSRLGARASPSARARPWCDLDSGSKSGRGSLQGSPTAGCRSERGGDGRELRRESSTAGWERAVERCRADREAGSSSPDHSLDTLRAVDGARDYYRLVHRGADTGDEVRDVAVEAVGQEV